MIKSVKKRNGRIEPFSVDKINACAERACEGLSISPSDLVLSAQLELFEKIPTAEIDNALILAARGKMYQDDEWSKVAARLLINTLYKEVLKESVDCDTFDSDYRSVFIRNTKRLVRQGRLDERVSDYNLKEIANLLVPDRDFLIEYSGAQNIYDRYLLRHDGKVIETPQAFYMRIAMGVCLEEPEEIKQERVRELYEIYSQHLACPSTPTLFNSGTTHNQLSSCYLSKIPDSVDGIFDSLKQEARKSKFSGGLGFHVSSIRGMGSEVKGTHGKSSGLIPWLKVYNDMLIACDQGGKRKGSGCAYLEPWHIDVEDFLDLRREGGEERRRAHDLNTALWCPDLFFQRVKEGGEWMLICPSEAPDLPDLFGKKFEKRYAQLEEEARAGNIKNFKFIEAKALWKRVLKTLFETSHPWITFKDVSNERYSNSHEGTVYGSNLCTEIILHTKASEYNNEFGNKTEVGETAVCNLASLCLPKFFKEGKLDEEKLAHTIRNVIRGLDNVIDINFYPTEEAQKANMSHRPIGMGTMGWANVYAALGIKQDSEEAVKFTDDLMEFISFHAIKTSCELAKERGAYSTYEGSLWSRGLLPIDTYCSFIKNTGKVFVGKEQSESKLDWNSLREDIKQYGMRNSNVMAIAPNASIAYQLGVEQSIEPFFRIVYRYENMSGNYFIVNGDLIRELKNRGIWDLQVAEKIKDSLGDLSLVDEIPDDLRPLFMTAYDRDQLMLVKVNAARQKWIDQAISFNLYIGGKPSLNESGSPSLKYLNDMYYCAWEHGLKSTYYLRNVSATKTQQVTKKKEEKEEAPIEMVQGQSCSMEDGCVTCEG